MSRWPVVPLGDLLTYAADSHMVIPDAVYPIAGVYGFGRGMIKRPPVSGQAIAASQLFKIRAGQFIYSRLKSFEGAYAIVSDEVNDHFVSNEFPAFDINQECLNPAYLGWYFKQQNVWQQLASDGKGIGARRERLHQDRFLDHAIALPSVEEQKRIAHRLDRVEEQVTLRQREAEATAAELTATLRTAFDKAVAGMPLVRLGDVAPVVRRPIEIDPEGVYAEVGARAFGRGLFNKPNVVGKDLTWQKLFRIRAGDLVFSNIKAWEGAFAVARPDHDGKVGSHRYLTCIPDLSRVSPDFVWYFLQSPAGITQVQAASPGSADRNRTLRQTGLEAIMMPIPSLDAQSWFDSLQAKAAAARATQAAASTELAILLPALLNQAFSGC